MKQVLRLQPSTRGLKKNHFLKKKEVIAVGRKIRKIMK